MKAYTFCNKENKVINAAYAETVEETAKICGLEKTDYDRFEEKDITPESGFSLTQTTAKLEHIKKPRSDKGTTRKKKEGAPAAPKGTRRAALFFVLNEDFENPNHLKGPFIKKEVEKYLSSKSSDKTRVIVGHEISFVKKIQFKGM
jgi:hypothetical protein